MSCYDRKPMLGIIGCTCGISVLLQGLGVFSASWIIVSFGNNSSTDCHLGLLWSQCDRDTLAVFTNVTDPSKAVVGLQITSFVLLLLTTVTFLIYAAVCICDEEEEGGKVQVICIISSYVGYVITGILIISGCIGSAGEQKDASMGWSFYVSLTAGCYIIVKTIFSYIIACWALNSRHKPARRRRKRRRRIPSEAYKDPTVSTIDVATSNKVVELQISNTDTGISSQKEEASSNGV